jgi:hypothetical protein
MTRAEDWVDFIQEILISKTAERIGLLVHQYRGGIETEEIEILDRQAVPLKKLTPQFLIELREDVIYDFVL